MGSSIGEATGLRKGGRVKHFRPFFVPCVCVTQWCRFFFFFSRRRELLVEDLTARKSRSSGYVNNVTD